MPGSDAQNGNKGRADLPALLDTALDAARQAGELANARFCTDVRCKRKADGSPVTEVDLAVDALLRERLLGALPGAGWLSEESTQGDAWHWHERVWVVDPLDGTSGFLRRDRHWCIAIALLERGVPVLGVIHAPALGHSWWAHAGGGAFLDGAPARVSTRSTLEGATLIGPKSIANPAMWATPWPPVTVRRYPSLALRLAYVASAEADGMLALGGKNYWDVAAGDIIVREAGGRVSDITGAPLIYADAGARVNGVIAAPPALFARMAALARGWRGGAGKGAMQHQRGKRA